MELAELLSSSRIAKPDGPVGAKIAIVAARPGKHEVNLCDCPKGLHPTGIGLVGPSGNLLWKLLAKHGISRRDCYVTNVRKDYSESHSVPTRNEVLEARPELLQELDRIRPNIILALGSEALYALTGKVSIENWRGSLIRDLSGRKVLASWHPAACLRTYQWTYVLDADLYRLSNECRSPELVLRNRRLIVDPSLDEAVETLRSFRSPVCVDIETFGYNISCIGVADSAERAICIPLAGPARMSLSERAQALRELYKVLQLELFGQNVCMFDIPILEGFGFKCGPVKCDSMLAHHLLWPELGMKSKDSASGLEKFAGSHDLAFITSVYTDIPYYKDLAQRWREKDPPDWEMYWKYNLLDCVATYEACEGLLGELEEFNQLDYYNEHVLGLVKPVLQMQNNGMLVDKTKLDSVRSRIELERTYLQEKLNHEVGFSINVRSTTDIRYLIQDVLKISGLVKGTKKKGLPSTDKETLRTLAYNSPHSEVFQTILEIRERRTLMSSFLTMEVGPDGRYRARYKIHGTDSGRLSSQSPGGFEGRKGPQLQNVPKSARRLFVSPDDRSFVQCDQRRAEAMFVAFDSGDTRLIELFNDPSRDLYREAAADSLSISLDEIEDDIRQIFKHIVLGCNYGLGANRLIGTLRTIRAGINIEDVTVRGITNPFKKAEYLLESYHQKFPGVRQWHARIREEIKRSRTLFDGHGRRRFFMGRLYGKDGENTERIAFSFRPQASIAGTTNQAVRRLVAAGLMVVSQVHDSVKVECWDHEIPSTIVAVEAAMRHTFTLPGGSLTVPLDTTVGKNWKEMSSWKETP